LGPMPSVSRTRVRPVAGTKLASKRAYTNLGVYILARHTDLLGYSLRSAIASSGGLDMSM